MTLIFPGLDYRREITNTDCTGDHSCYRMDLSKKAPVLFIYLHSRNTSQNPISNQRHSRTDSGRDSQAYTMWEVKLDDQKSLVLLQSPNIPLQQALSIHRQVPPSISFIPFLCHLQAATTHANAMLHHLIHADWGKQSIHARRMKPLPEALLRFPFQPGPFLQLKQIIMWSCFCWGLRAWATVDQTSQKSAHQ